MSAMEKAMFSVLYNVLCKFLNYVSAVIHQSIFVLQHGKMDLWNVCEQTTPSSAPICLDQPLYLHERGLISN